jgi:hypothetical protein
MQVQEIPVNQVRCQTNGRRVPESGHMEEGLAPRREFGLQPIYFPGEQAQAQK